MFFLPLEELKHISGPLRQIKLFKLNIVFQIFKKYM